MSNIAQARAQWGGEFKDETGSEMIAELDAVDSRVREKDTEMGPSHDVLMARYLEMLSYVERLHRLLLDVIKDEFERIGCMDLNSVQALLLFNIGDHEVTAGELKTRGYYQGSNVSYNLKKMVEAGYIHHQRSDVDRRSVRISLTAKGAAMRQTIADLFDRHVTQMTHKHPELAEGMGDGNAVFRHMEQFWAQQIRYIY